MGRGFVRPVIQEPQLLGDGLERRKPRAEPHGAAAAGGTAGRHQTRLKHIATGGGGRPPGPVRKRSLCPFGLLPAVVPFCAGAPCRRFPPLRHCSCERAELGFRAALRPAVGVGGGGCAALSLAGTQQVGQQLTSKAPVSHSAHQRGALARQRELLWERLRAAGN